MQGFKLEKMKKRDTRTAEILSSSLDPCFFFQKWLPKGVLLSKTVAPPNGCYSPPSSFPFYPSFLRFTGFSIRCLQHFSAAVRFFSLQRGVSAQILAAVEKTRFLAPMCTIFVFCP